MPYFICNLYKLKKNIYGRDLIINTNEKDFLLSLNNNNNSIDNNNDE